tara:strand:+ start:1539 stop:2261 length:723 start_codon:yes stop_codon:yes gene_type:complete
MKYVILFFFIPMCFHAQQDPELVSRNRPGLFWFVNGKGPLDDADYRKYDRCIVDVTYNDWIGDLSTFQNKWNSLGYHFSLNKDIQFRSSQRTTIGLGFGYSYLNHTLDAVFSNTPNKSVSAQIHGTTDSLIFSKLTIHQFYVPIELRFKSLGWRHFKFIIGSRIGVQPLLFSKTKYWESGAEQFYDDKLLDMRWFFTSVYVRCGIRNWSFIGIFHPMKLFPSEQSVRLYPFQIGLSLSLF